MEKATVPRFPCPASRRDVPFLISPFLRDTSLQRKITTSQKLLLKYQRNEQKNFFNIEIYAARSGNQRGDQSWRREAGKNPKKKTRPSERNIGLIKQTGKGYARACSSRNDVVRGNYAFPYSTNAERSRSIRSKKPGYLKSHARLPQKRFSKSMNLPLSE